jgi:hypothetical protein
MKVIQVYAPIIEYKNEEIEDFYEDIEITLRKNNCYYIFLMKNFKISKQMDTMEIAIGKFCLDGRNERNEILNKFPTSRQPIFNLTAS